MNFSTFPLDNVYFNKGFEALWGLNSCLLINNNDVIVVSISSWSVKDVVSSAWIEKLEHGSIIIISHRRFLPLAKYYQRINKNVIEICEEADSVEVLYALCHGWSITRIPIRHEISHLTEKEFISLRYALDGVSAKEQAYSMGISPKTVFRFRDSLAKKLQVRKLSHLMYQTIYGHL